MTSFKPNHLPKAPSANAITLVGGVGSDGGSSLRFGASTHDFWDIHVSR